MKITMTSSVVAVRKRYVRSALYSCYYENPNEIWKLYGKRKGRYIDGVFEDIIET